MVDLGVEVIKELSFELSLESVEEAIEWRMQAVADSLVLYSSVCWKCCLRLQVCYVCGGRLIESERDCVEIAQMFVVHDSAVAFLPNECPA